MSKKSKILVVDDQPEHLHTIEKILNESGDEYDIIVASNGDIACRVAKKELPDLIVMDWDMPLMNGLEATKNICTDEETRDIPVIITTGVMISPKDMTTAFEAGATEFLRKPIENVELITRVRSMLKLSQKFKEVKAHKAELEKQNIELKEKNEELDAFNHTVAHDLRNPLTIIFGYLGIINEYMQPDCNENQRMLITRTLDVAANMAKIIDALLLFASVGKSEEVELEAIDTNTIVEKILKFNDKLISNRQPVIEVEKNMHTAIGYAEWIEEVWSNLINNAIKYGGDPLTIKIGSVPVNDHVKFWIRNNGRVLTKEEQEIVFNQFTRGNVKKIEGHGLGLSIVSRIIKKLHGEIGIESTVTEGTTVYFTLPAN